MNDHDPGPCAQLAGRGGPDDPVRLVLSAPAGHALARFPLPGKEVIFLILLALMMLPFRALLIPPCLRPNFLGRTATEAGLAVLHTGLSGSIRPDPGPRRTRP